jgi:MFS family permease
MAAMTVSGINGGPLAGMIMSGADGRWGLHGWQWLFIIEGLPGCLIGLLTYRLLPNGPAEARWLNESQRALIAEDLQADARHIGSGAPRSFRSALLDRRLYVLATMSVALIAGIGGLSLWLPTVIRNSGISSVFDIGLLSALPYVVAVVVQQIVARRSDRLQERRWHSGALVLVAAAGWFALPLAQGNATLSVLALTVTAAGLFGATGPFWSMPAAYFRDTAAAGGIALVTTFGGIASFVSPIVVGWFTTRTGSLVVGQYYYGALAALAALVLVYGTRQSSNSGTGIA